MLKRTVWKDKFEVTYVGASQVLIKPLNSEALGVTIKSMYGREIGDLKIMGKDQYVIAHTDETLIVADLQNQLLSEVLISFFSLNLFPYCHCI